ncbi:YbaB/EbfC family DNA-binding protein [Candidatus Dojkabacteria bacterium]|uniref:YbaB/EbfC family DNA-binding protein n=1 Tax=Candidatus Dojkabacteria bacterium TaxID=2099670 RepID=A0A3M0Z2D3_9BACT|nr:MAG: YbaB/EbfC family DNA-binding protein [Candidatus Dojkabacteria bacterium]
MGVFDMAKLAQKAMQARKKISKLTAVGSSGSVSLLINGLYEFLEIEINGEKLIEGSKILTGADPETIREIVGEITSIIKFDVLKAYERARAALEKEMSTSNIEDLKDLLGG